MDPLTAFKDRLKEKRLLNSLSQKDLALKTAVSVTTIQKYESGASLPKGIHLVSLANVLNCSIDWLMIGIDPLDAYIKKNPMSTKHSSQIDIKLLEDIITGVEQWLSERELELDPTSKAELESLLYEQLISNHGKYDTGTVERFMRLATK